MIMVQLGGLSSCGGSQFAGNYIVGPGGSESSRGLRCLEHARVHVCGLVTPWVLSRRCRVVYSANDASFVCHGRGCSD
jgi:hypothetical protein